MPMFDERCWQGSPPSLEKFHLTRHYRFDGKHSPDLDSIIVESAQKTAQRPFRWRSPANQTTTLQRIESQLLDVLAMRSYDDFEVSLPVIRNGEAHQMVILLELVGSVAAEPTPNPHVPEM